jgi:hypothetical protein
MLTDNLISYIEKSIYDTKGKVSSARISSYIILITIVLSTIIFLIIDIVNLIKTDGVYTIPVEHAIIFGMVLTHHLFLLGIKKSSESDDNKIEK